MTNMREEEPRPTTSDGQNNTTRRAEPDDIRATPPSTVPDQRSAASPADPDDDHLSPAPISSPTSSASQEEPPSIAPDQGSAPNPAEPDGQQSSSTTEARPSAPRPAESDGAQHFSPQVPAGPGLLMAYSSLTGTIVGTFALRQPNVAPVAVALAIALVVACWAGATFWTLRSAKAVRDVGRGSRSFRGLWYGTASVAVLTLGLLTIYVFWQGLKPIPRYDSAYDGTDVTLSGCAAGRRVATVPGTTLPVTDANGTWVGDLSLRTSYKCTTVWAEVAYPAGVGAGHEYRITLVRQRDGAEATFRSLPEHDQRMSQGNMLYNGAACVRAQVQVLNVGSERLGPVVETDRCV